jgi:deoxyhypusine monooxygenase
MTTLREVDAATTATLQAKLADPTTSLPMKYRILFSLRNIAGKSAHEAMLLGMKVFHILNSGNSYSPLAITSNSITCMRQTTVYLNFYFLFDAGLKDDSALFRHEVAYCLGQRQDPAAIAILTQMLADSEEHPMVRHEAAEALGAIATEACLFPLRRHVDDPCLEVAQTCQLALQRIQYFQAMQSEAATGAETDRSDPSPYLSVDPTPPAPASTPTETLRKCLLDENARIFDRYRAMFALRNRGGSEAVDALSASFAASRSALLKHEVAYVLGQMQDGGAVRRLQEVIENCSENAMVRHEAAEALGSIAAPECIALLEKVWSQRIRHYRCLLEAYFCFSSLNCIGLGREIY